ncbi:hypothetical protein ACJMK2_007290 [Sinanodonta woodiana]|uniref:Uncharacterized protein n=1 Tax=Sinanodonta woodiana TaxID=1069815 RepID=A0ABD3VI37_SINWO
MGRGESNQFMMYQAARRHRTEQARHGPRRVKSMHDLSTSQVAEDRTIETWAEESQINSAFIKQPVGREQNNRYMGRGESNQFMIYQSQEAEDRTIKKWADESQIKSGFIKMPGGRRQNNRDMGRGESYQVARRQRTEQSRHGPRKVKSIHDLSSSQVAEDRTIETWVEESQINSGFIKMPRGRGQNNRDMGRGESNQFRIYQDARRQITEQSRHGPRRVKSIQDLSRCQEAEDKTIETWAEESQINSGFIKMPGGRGLNNRDMGRGESYQVARRQRTEQSRHGPRRVKSIHDLSSSQVAED